MTIVNSIGNVPSDPIDEANSERIRERAGPITVQVDSFTPAHSAFGLPIYVAPLPAGSIQRACRDILPWLISFSLGVLNSP
jgi:hypothetical protein